MNEKDLDTAIEKCKRIMEFDTRTLKNPESEDGWLFDKVYDLLQFLRQLQFGTDTNVGGNLIDRQAAIEAMRRAKDKSELHRMLVQLPSAQPERKNGHWLRYGEDGYPNNEDTVFWQCDQCLEQYTGRTKRIPNFCPNCGADMRGEQDG